MLIGDPKQKGSTRSGAPTSTPTWRRHGAPAPAQRSRSTGAATRACSRPIDALFGDARLGHTGIAYRSVRAADANREPRRSAHHTPSRCACASCTATTRRSRRPATATRATTPHAGTSRRTSRATWSGCSRARGSSAVPRTAVLGHDLVCPGHVAVLVRTHRQAALVRDALDAVEIPAVINGAGVLLGQSPHATGCGSWRRSSAPARPPAPAPPRSRRSWAGTPSASRAHPTTSGRRSTGGCTSGRACCARGGRGAAGDDHADRGPARPRALRGGRRVPLDDLRHLGQLLHAAAAAERLGATALTGWLRQRIAAAEQETGDEERSRRLSPMPRRSGVLTIHRSKGLEFPIVYYPYLWEPTWLGREREEPVFFHDPANGDARTIDVGLDGRAFAEHVEQYVLEARGETCGSPTSRSPGQVRHQAVVWWAGRPTRESALSRLPFARGEDGTIPAKGPATPSDLAAVTRLNDLAAAAPGRDRGRAPDARAAAPVGGHAARHRGARRRRVRPRAGPALAAHVVLRHHGGGLRGARGDEPEEVLLDEPAAAAPPGELAAAADDEYALRGQVPGRADRDGRRRARRHARPHRARGHRLHRAGPARGARGTRRRVPGPAAGGDRRARARRRGAGGAIETLLGPLVGDLRLRDVARGDRLDELAFELPLVGGDDPTGRVALTW